MVQQLIRQSVYFWTQVINGILVQNELIVGSESDPSCGYVLNVELRSIYFTILKTSMLAL